MSIPIIPATDMVKNNELDKKNYHYNTGSSNVTVN